MCELRYQFPVRRWNPLHGGQLQPGSGCEHTPDDSACASGGLCITDTRDPVEGCVESITPDCCGNGIPETGEGCDDGNIQNSDGCSPSCQCEGDFVDCNGDGLCDCPTAECLDGECLGCNAITTCEELQAIPASSQLTWCLVNDIDCSETETWNGGEGFSPIGNFGGVFLGGGYTISGLSMTRPSLSNQALFASTYQATIEDVHLVDVEIVGSSNLGAVVGSGFSSSLTAITVKGKLTGSNSVGGIAGNLSFLL